VDVREAGQGPGLAEGLPPEHAADRRPLTPLSVIM
jgi:hypothetical protein